MKRIKKSTCSGSVAIGVLGFALLFMPSFLLSQETQPGQQAVPVTKTLPFPGDVFQVAGRTAFVILPDKPMERETIPWVWYAPTLKGLPQDAEKWMFRQLLDEGIAIAGIDVGESYGSPAGRQLFQTFYEAMVKERGLSKTPCLLARSRGGLMHYGWAVEHPECLAGIAGIYPVCDLTSYPGIQRACTAYGMSAEQLESKLHELNPIELLEPLAKAQVPIFHIQGDSDKVVPLEQNSAELAIRYRKWGGPVEIDVIKGQGHNMWRGWFESQTLVDFLISHCKNSPSTK
ncbi:MAG: prolyl oligopeptidase family serine peptidase [Planctomycetaceae bacterium]|nr:prolyl oligopeptidase family serine peptidase [Planctomycetaceae bacterium]